MAEKSDSDDRLLAEWENEDVQSVYHLICDVNDAPKHPEEHWEGWLARRIVARVVHPYNARIRELEAELAQHKPRPKGCCCEFSDDQETVVSWCKIHAPLKQVLAGTHVIIPVEPTIEWLNNVQYAAEFHGLSIKQVTDIYRTVTEAAQEKNDG
jgi:hypothetical protein